MTRSTAQAEVQVTQTATRPRVMSASRRRRVRIIGVGILLLGSFAVAEVSSYLACTLYLQQAAPFVFYAPPLEQAVAGFDAYMAKRHPVLGWPSPANFGPGGYDASGSRKVPSFPTPGNACASLYGDSMTWGDEADEEHAWGNVLARRLGCRVANYGVAGYGVDQAYLRFKLNEADEARVPILTVFPENLLRNVNQYRQLLTGVGMSFSFKPRFRVNDAGSLELIPLPTFTKGQFADLLRDPAKYLPHEYFLPDTPAGPLRFHFPYTLFVLRAARNAQMQASVRTALGGPPTWTPFFSPNHPSRSLQIAIGILEGFHRDAVARARMPLIQILPTPTAIATFQATGTWPYAPLIDAMAAKGIEVVNLGPPFIERLGGRKLCELLTHPESCNGHYNSEGYATLAEIVHSVMRARDMTPQGAHT